MLLFALLASMFPSARDSLSLGDQVIFRIFGPRLFHGHTCRVLSPICPITSVSHLHTLHNDQPRNKASISPSVYISCPNSCISSLLTVKTVFLGPNAPIGHGSVFTITELLAEYISNVIRKCQTERIKAIAPSKGAVDELYERTQAFIPRTAWAGSCASWFKNGTETGPVTALHPGSRIHFFHMLERFRGEDWDYVYDTRQNRFSYLGNGISTKEIDGSDSTWYLNQD